MYRKNSKIYLFFSLLCLLIFCHSVAKAENGIILDELLTDVQKTIIRVRDAIEENDLPPLKNVALNLKIAVLPKPKIKFCID